MVRCFSGLAAGVDLALDLSSVTEGRLSLEVIRGVSLSSLESKGLHGCWPELRHRAS